MTSNLPTKVVSDEFPSSMGLFEAIYTLRATRIYDPRPLPLDVIGQILRATTMAGSAGNTQPWEFVVVTDKDTKLKLREMVTEPWIRNVEGRRSQTAEQLVDSVGRSVTAQAALDNLEQAGAIIFLFWNPDRGIRFHDQYEELPDGTLRELRPVPGERGASIFPAAQNLMLAAHGLGVATLFHSFFRLIEPEVKEFLHVPARMFLECSILVGYGNEKLGRPRRIDYEQVTHLEDWDHLFPQLDS